MSRDEVVNFISLSKYFAWNFQPSKEGKSGSIEFRRPPAITTTKKTKHWVSFTMAFVWMAMNGNLDAFVRASGKTGAKFQKLHPPNFEEQLLRAAKEIGVFWSLDPRLRQEDDVKNLHITTMDEQAFRWLAKSGLGYRCSQNG
ncbi:uncharacterized protein F4807DRAFT_463530 [Annulohypoxylon truncatum]|uniref:uncharacterized protein n=1 Tax=Annulohypoxylon truncatum TaxID=327061 RepID=UPI00200870A5|nr:uncharacterized protein F4807DRAFT_463530 [Annulohypoxylon truncatum]KAI1206584.1 hypothetical protein F4807DRAFT_463530 [Annulohypoxylon truncatum]